MKQFKLIYKALVVVLIAFSTSCDDDNHFSLTPSLGFEKTQGSVKESNSLRIGFTSNTTYTEPVKVTIAINNFQGLEYGTDYITDPEPVNNVITVTLDPETEQPSFGFYPIVTGAERKIGFEITSVEGGKFKLAQQTARTYMLTIKPGSTITISHDFEDCVASSVPASFTQFYETGTGLRQANGWVCQTFGRTGSAPRANAYNSSVTPAAEVRAWLIRSTPMTIAQGATTTISLYSFSQYSGTSGSVKVKWSSNYSGTGDPTTATWTELTTLSAQFPAGGSRSWTPITGTFSNISGNNVYLAFHFVEGMTSSSNAYDIDDLTITIE